MRNLVIVFAKNPVPGKAKTRLSKDIGQGQAMVVYRDLLRYTSALVEKVNAHRWVSYADFLNPCDMWPADKFQKSVQSSGNLGDRMVSAFQKAHAERFESMVLIGTDAYDLNTEDIEQAFQALKSNDLVLGPTHDGGYYLIGMNRPWPELFEGIEWSTDSVFSTTLEKARKSKLSTFILPKKSDIDHVEDIPQSKLEELEIHHG